MSKYRLRLFVCLAGALCLTACAGASSRKTLKTAELSLMHFASGFDPQKDTPFADSGMKFGPNGDVTLKIEKGVGTDQAMFVYQPEENETETKETKTTEEEEEKKIKDSYFLSIPKGLKATIELAHAKMIIESVSITAKDELKNEEFELTALKASDEAGHFLKAKEGASLASFAYAGDGALKLTFLTVTYETKNVPLEDKDQDKDKGPNSGPDGSQEGSTSEGEDPYSLWDEDRVYDEPEPGTKGKEAELPFPSDGVSFDFTKLPEEGAELDKNPAEGGFPTIEESGEEKYGLYAGEGNIVLLEIKPTDEKRPMMTSHYSLNNKGGIVFKLAPDTTVGISLPGDGNDRRLKGVTVHIDGEFRQITDLLTYQCSFDPNDGTLKPDLFARWLSFSPQSVTYDLLGVSVEYYDPQEIADLDAVLAGKVDDNTFDLTTVPEDLQGTGETMEDGTTHYDFPQEYSLISGDSLVSLSINTEDEAADPSYYLKDALGNVRLLLMKKSKVLIKVEGNRQIKGITLGTDDPSYHEKKNDLELVNAAFDPDDEKAIVAQLGMTSFYMTYNGDSPLELQSIKVEHFDADLAIPKNGVKFDLSKVPEGALGTDVEGGGTSYDFPADGLMAGADNFASLKIEEGDSHYLTKDDKTVFVFKKGSELKINVTGLRCLQMINITAEKKITTADGDSWTELAANDLVATLGLISPNGVISVPAPTMSEIMGGTIPQDITISLSDDGPAEIHITSILVTYLSLESEA